MSFCKIIMPKVEYATFFNTILEYIQTLSLIPPLIAVLKYEPYNKDRRSRVVVEN